MILQHQLIEKNFYLKENKVNVIVIEDAKMFRSLNFQMKNQTEGEGGGFLLRKDLDILQFEKHIAFIDNLLALDDNFNNLKNKLYKSLETEANQYFIDEARLLHSEIVSFISKLHQSIDVPYQVNADAKISDILKSVNYQIAYDQDNLLDNLTKYCDLVNLVTNKEIFVVNNLKLFMSKEELERCYNYIFQKKYYIILIEGSFPQYQLDCEEIFLLDGDLCEIY